MHPGVEIVQGQIVEKRMQELECESQDPNVSDGERVGCKRVNIQAIGLRVFSIYRKNEHVVLLTARKSSPTILLFCKISLNIPFTILTKRRILPYLSTIAGVA